MPQPPASTQEKLIDGRKTSQKLLEQLKGELSQLKAAGQLQPKLVVILVGEDPASQVYTKRKTKIAHEIGMASELLTFPADLPQADLLALIERLNAEETVHGILVQLPLPKHIDEKAVLNAVHPAKDVDGFHPVNLGRLLSGDLPPALPCTPSGIMTLLKDYAVEIAGKKAVVIGRSTIVGKPMGLLLLQANATVTFCHSRTRDLPAVAREADILVAAIGLPMKITADYVKPGAVVIDVGINRTDDGRLVGDVDFDSVAPQASLITPVPGGVGPMTIATLMANTLALYHARS